MRATTVLTMTLTGIAADVRERDRFALVAAGAFTAGRVPAPWHTRRE